MATQSEIDPDEEIARQVGSFAADPLNYARFAFPWGKGELTGMTGPRAWQREVMEEIRGHLQNPETRFEPLRIARASGVNTGIKTGQAPV